MKCEQVIEILEKIAPPSLAESWDNVGLLTGRKEKEIKKILIAVDATSDVVAEAISGEADLLLTHHPLIFSGMKSVTTDDFIGERIYKLINHDICYYTMHTNFDVTMMAQTVAEQLQLEKCEVLDITFQNDKITQGIGKVGFLSKEMNLKEFAEYLSVKCDVTGVRIFGNPDTKVHKVGLVPGSGKDYIKEAIYHKADVFITGDVGHHVGIDSMEKGMPIIDAGHYGLEKIFSVYMVKTLTKELPGITVQRAEEKSPFWTLL